MSLDDFVPKHNPAMLQDFGYLGPRISRDVKKEDGDIVIVRGSEWFADDDPAVETYPLFDAKGNLADALEWHSQYVIALLTNELRSVIGLDVEYTITIGMEQETDPIWGFRRVLGAMRIKEACDAKKTET